MTKVQDAQKFADLAVQYAAALKREDSDAEVILFDLCNAAMNVVDDGDFHAQRNVLMDEYGWDEDGYPVDEFGDAVDLPRLSFDPRCGVWWQA